MGRALWSREPRCTSAAVGNRAKTGDQDDTVHLDLHCHPMAVPVLRALRARAAALPGGPLSDPSHHRRKPALGWRPPGCLRRPRLLLEGSSVL